MNILMLIYVKIFVGSILTFLFLLAHQKFIHDYLFSILIWSHACVDKLHYFSDIFGLYYIWHYVRHYFTNFFEVFLLKLYDPCLH